MRAKQFISEPIEVGFDEPPLLDKAPGCPDRFGWRGATFEIEQPLESRVDFGSAPEAPSRRGSWGVGRFHFRARTVCGRVFDLYYDRAPAVSGGNRKGGWFVFRELDPET